VTIKDPSIVRVDNLYVYLEERGFEVVSGHWHKGEPYPVLFIRPISQQAPPEMASGAPDLSLPPRCRCGHGLMAHEAQGACLVAGCACRVYTCTTAGACDPRSER